MPIYEFFCSDCNTLYSFFSAGIDTQRHPDCPKCGRPELERRPARFATLSLSRSDDESGDDPFDQLDDEAMERAMMDMAGELEGLDDSEDPKVYARALRKMADATGLAMGPKMEELLARLDSGTDLEELEESFGDGDGGEDEDFEEYFQLKKKVALLSRRPKVDDELYFF